MTIHDHDVLTRAFPLTTCRDRVLQVLSFVDDEGPVVPEALRRLVDETECEQDHELHYAAIDSLVAADAAGLYKLSREGADWLTEYGRPASAWSAVTGQHRPPLRAWQVEALDAWAAHGRHGVVEAVTGTGKSRVGVEATREAIADGYSVVIAVPTIDLIRQWEKTLSAHGIKSVGMLGQGQRSSFDTCSVVVGTVQSLYLSPPRRPDGRVLLVADECHRYGAGQWRRILHSLYRRRLGLTATFERNDDGIEVLLTYFGGGSVYTIGFARAIADRVVAPYDVKLLGVRLTRAEQSRYKEADQTVKDCRVQLLAAGFPAEPFGAFMHEVQEAAKDDQDPTITEVARRYLKAFSERIEITACADAKLDAARRLAVTVQGSRGSIVFTSRVDAAEQIADVLSHAGVKAAAIHSELTRPQRTERLTHLKIGRLKALVAPTILDEGLDVPDVDLGIVMGGSKSRRQMIQRMGRVLRWKSDGRSATFVVVYAIDTHEDLTQTTGQEGCLDLILATANSIENPEDGPPKRAAQHIVTACPVERDDALPVHTVPDLAEPDLPVPVQMAPVEPSPVAASLTPSGTGKAAQAHVAHIERLAALRERDLLTDAEFTAAKARVLYG